MKICLISLRTGGERERVWVGMFSMTWRFWMGGGEESDALCLCACVLAFCTGSGILHPAQFRVACFCISRHRIFCTKQHCGDTMYPEETVRETHTSAFIPCKAVYEYTYTNTQFLHLSQLYLIVFYLSLFSILSFLPYTDTLRDT